MKIWCDVCSKKQASVFCTADEAALCDDCDPRVHQANKLASKHQRFSLLQPSSSQVPLCDICQEKKALLFCQQDRAILCRDCDVPIHNANDLTQKHDRFLLTGAKLSALPSVDATTKTTSTTINSKCLSNSDSESIGFEPVPDFRTQNSTTKRAPLSAASEASSPQPNLKAQPKANNTMTNYVNSEVINNHGNGGGSTSNISEYLLKMPGWQVEDLLDSSLDPNGFYKGNEDDLLFLDTGPDSRAISYENMGLWVPRAPHVFQPSPYNSSIYGVDGLEKDKGDMGRKVSRQRMDDSFTVPEINQQFVGSKRYRASY